MTSSSGGAESTPEPIPKPGEGEQVIDFRIRARWRGPATVSSISAQKRLFEALREVEGVIEVQEAAKNPWTRIEPGG